MKKKLHAFVLLEVSIALLILGIVSSIIYSQFAMMQNLKARQITHQNIEIVLKSLGIYYLNNGGKLPSIQTDLNGFGPVPFRQMGIMERWANDGFGRKLQIKINPLFRKNLGIVTQNDMNILDGSKFNPDNKMDKIAIVIKSGEEEQWISEYNFIYLYCNGKIFESPRQKPGITNSAFAKK